VIRLNGIGGVTFKTRIEMLGPGFFAFLVVVILSEAWLSRTDLKIRPFK
jgi:hypothetical protein